MNINTNSHIDHAERLNMAIAQIHAALSAINDAARRPLRPEFTADGETHAAETAHGRAEHALDVLRTSLLEIALDTSDDPGATARYVSWMAKQRCSANWSTALTDQWMQSTDGIRIGIGDLADAIAKHNGEPDNSIAYHTAALYWWRQANLTRRIMLHNVSKIRRVVYADTRK